MSAPQELLQAMNLHLVHFILLHIIPKEFSHPGFLQEQNLTTTIWTN